MYLNHKHQTQKQIQPTSNNQDDYDDDDDDVKSYIQTNSIYHRSPPPRNTNASSGSPDQTSEKRYRPQKFCAVCGDRAIACNFNAVTCESCKAFFRRNAFKEKLKCLFEDKCVIDKVTRRFCSRCRLKKCIDIGMKREWILSDEEKFNKRMKIIQNKQKRVHSISQDGLPIEVLKGDGNRQVDRHDASTSCPDEIDLAMGDGPAFLYCPHPCQNCQNIIMAKSHSLTNGRISTDDGRSCSSINPFGDKQIAKSPLNDSNCSPSYYGEERRQQFRNDIEYSPQNESCSPNSISTNSQHQQTYNQNVYIPGCKIGSANATPDLTRCSAMKSNQILLGPPSRSTDETISGSLDVLKDRENGLLSHSGKKNPTSTLSVTPTTSTSVSYCDSFITGTTTIFSQINNAVNHRSEMNMSSCDCHPIVYDFDKNTSNDYANESTSANIYSESNSNKNSFACQSEEVVCQDMGKTRVAVDINSAKTTKPNANNICLITSCADSNNGYAEEKEDSFVDDARAMELAKNNIICSSPVYLPGDMVSYDGGKTVYALPCETEAQIEARLDQSDLYPQERERINELLHASKLLFEHNNQATIVEERTGDALVDVVQMCDYTLRRFIKTVKQINAFKMLTMDDQIALLKAACFKILILRSAHHFTDKFCGWRCSRTGKVLSLDVLKQAKKSFVYDLHKNLIVTFDRPLRQDRVIVGLLCMILLFDTSNSKSLKHGHAIHLEHVNYLCMLKKYLLSGQPDPLSKYEKLMDTLKQINATNDEYNNFFSNDFQRAQITPLIVEIFDIGSI